MFKKVYMSRSLFLSEKDLMLFARPLIAVIIFSEDLLAAINAKWLKLYYP